MTDPMQCAGLLPTWRLRGKLVDFTANTSAMAFRMLLVCFVTRPIFSVSSFDERLKTPVPVTDFMMPEPPCG